MQANLTNFYLELKAAKQVQIRDLNGHVIEGKIHLISPAEQTIILFTDQKLLMKPIKDLASIKILSDRKTVKVRSEKVFQRCDEQFQSSTLDSDAKYDQFEAMQKKFGLKPSFDEEHYTTRLSHVSEELRSFAEKEAKFVQEMPTQDKHILEERNLKELNDNDEDEEPIYSSVIREEIPLFYNSNTFTQPKLIPDEEEQHIKKPINQGPSRFVVIPHNGSNFHKSLLLNYLNAQEGFKWQTLHPDPQRNKKERIVQQNKQSRV